MRHCSSIVGFCLIGLLAAAPSARASFHLYDVREVYSSADGSVQFVELFTSINGQHFLDGHTIVASQDAATRTFTFQGTGPTPTGGRALLIATAALQSVCGLVPDYILPDDFLFSPDGSVEFGPGADTIGYDSLPLDGARSLNFPSGDLASSSPENHAGESCSLQLSLSVVDQFQLNGNSAIILGDNSQTQSFTVGLDGVLEGIEVLVEPRGEPPVNLTFEVLDLSEGELATAPVLASVLIAPEEMGNLAVPLALDDVVQTFVDLKPFDVHVASGDILAFRMVAPGASFPDAYATSVQMPDNYARGERIGSPDSDLVFKTFVPEPSSALMARAAIAVLLVMASTRIRTGPLAP